MRLAAAAALTGGLLLALLLVAHYGAAEVGEAMAAVGWAGFAALCALHLGAIALTGLAWRALLPGATRWILVRARLVRDAAAEVLPLSQLGGYLFGARAAMLHGLSCADAIASTIVDVTLEVVAQLAYTVLGLALLMRFRPDNRLVLPLSFGLVAMAVAMAAFVTVQRRGLGRLGRRIDSLVARWTIGSRAAGEVRTAVLRLHRDRAALLRSTALHFLGWIAVGLEAWVVLRMMGVPLGLPSVLAIESLLHAARSAAFFVPNAVGVQEGAYVALGGLFGLPPEAALALSLLKRGRDLAIGVPVLLAWQVGEGRRWWCARPTERLSLRRGRAN